MNDREAGRVESRAGFFVPPISPNSPTGGLPMPTLMDYDDLASVLRLSKPTLSRLVRDGEIDVIRVGRRVLFRPEAVEKFINRKSTEEK
jgi:excisionase family DNA binding protein